MLVNGFATALLWGWALMLRASHAVGRFVELCFLCGFLRFARFLNVDVRQWSLMVVNGFWLALLALLAMVVNAFFVGYGTNAR